MTSRYPLILAAVGLFTVVQVGNGQSPPLAQPEQPAAATPQPDRIALVDIGAILKESAFVKAKMEALRADVLELDKEAQKIFAQITSRKTDLGGLKPGTSEYAAVTRELSRLTEKFETFRKEKKAALELKEGEIYRTAYLGVTEIIQEYAKQRGYTLVIRFSRESVGNSNDPNEVLKRIASVQYVYYDASRDITDAIIRLHNEKHKPKP